MKKYLFIPLLACLILGAATTTSLAYDNYWKNLPGNTAPSAMPMAVDASAYTLFSLDQDQLRTFLWRVGNNFENGAQIMLPTPEMTYRSFRVWETPMMEPELANKYPEIRTFTAVADDNPSVHAKLDYTPMGFHAMVYEGDKTYLVSPYSLTADGYYVAFYRKDQGKSAFLGGCDLPGSQVERMARGLELQLNKAPKEASGTVAQRVNGAQRHVYRLALSCTGEYAMTVAGPAPTKALVMGQMVSTLNRVNGIYEAELSVSFTLVGNNDLIVYINPNTDPYNCNANLNCLIDEVQTNVTGVIGEANYDVGHILCTAGGGLAQLNAVCGGGKARGTSSSGGPEDFSTMLHEMGHQFGSNHTFSAGTGGCAGNGNEGTGYEPGSGNSIMSYAGLCAPNDVGESLDYFHVSSFNEISTFLTDQGSTCGTTNPGTNPVVIPDIADSFYIPVNTPFELTAPVATAAQSGAEIYYSWEQYDLGNFEGTEAQNGSSDEGPNMRSYFPDTVRMRSYPTYELINNNSYQGPGNRLPTVARTMRFKLTARSVAQGWGTFHFIDSVVRIITVPGSDFRVTAPDEEETWEPGETKTIEWEVAGTDQEPINCNWVNIYLSLNDGKTYPYLLVANAPNTGSFNVTVPDVFTTTGRIKVKGSGNVFFDVNKAQVTINGNPNSIQQPDLAEEVNIYPNPATNTVQVNTTKALTVRMYNVLGQLVWNGKVDRQLSIPVAAFARGQYMLQCLDETSGATTTQKVILQ